MFSYISTSYKNLKFKTEGTVTEMDDPSQEYKRSVGVTLMQKPSRTMQFNFLAYF